MIIASVPKEWLNQLHKIVFFSGIRSLLVTLYFEYLRRTGLVVNPRGWRMNDEVPLQRKAFSTGIKEKPGH